MSDKPQIKILIPLIDYAHQDSVWYESGKDIARLFYKNREVVVICNGEINVAVHDGKGQAKDFWNKYNNGNMDELKEMVKDDTHLGELGDKEMIEWSNNNWFELLTRKVDEKGFDGHMGDVAYDYEEAMVWAKEFIQDDENWEE